MSALDFTRRFGIPLGMWLMIGACALNSRPALSPQKVAELWVEPADLESRDLFYGPGRSQHVPNPTDRYEFLNIKPSGVNPGYDVKDSRGQEWSVKQGVEARTEVVISRVVWAIGYYQPDVYYLPQWTLVREGKETAEGQARFRLEPPHQKKVAEWSWRKNPFLGTRELSGLFVLMVLFNNWDLKTAQNAVYEVKENGDSARTWYMVRDLGPALGRSAWLGFGSKDDSVGFARERFVVRVEGNRVRFGFQGGWMEPQLHTTVTPAQLRWVCGLLARLSQKQWLDAFRAGGYSEAEAQPFIRSLKQRIDEGSKTGSM